MIFVLVKKLGAGLAVATAAAGLTWVSTGPTLAVALAEPRAWFDDPLHGTTFPPEEAIVVVTHATHPKGVDTVMLRVDGEVVDTRTGGGGALATVEFEWLPPGEGDFELEVRGRTKGKDGTPGIAVVTIGDVPTGEEPSRSAPTTTTTAPSGEDDPDPEATDGDGPEETTTTATGPGGTVPPTTPPGTAPPPTSPPGTQPPPTTPPPTSPPTTQCQKPAPTLTSPANNASTPFRSPTLEWSYSGCAVGGFQVQISRRDDFGVLVATSPMLAPSARSWTVSPQLACGGPYYWRVRWDDRPVQGPWSAVRSFTIVARIC